MTLKSTMNQMQHYVYAGFPILYLHTYEELKADQLIRELAKATERSVLEWDAANGLREWADDQGNDVLIRQHMLDTELEQTLQMLKESGELSNRLFVIKDGHPYLQDARTIRSLKEIAHRILTGEASAVVVLISPVLTIPRELEKYMTVLEFEHMDEQAIRSIIHEFTSYYKLPDIAPKLLEDTIAAFKGLSEFEIRNILSLAYANDGAFDKVDLRLIHEHKQQVIMKSGILQMIQLKEDLQDIGGLENLKVWLKKKAFVMKDSKHARAFGVDMPKGVLIAGVPGCGKSLAAKAVAKLFDVPLLRLDMGRLLGKYVGESEANMRSAIALADAISPCVLWIDELEKAFAGIGDGGGGAEVTTRLFGNFLTWMQEKTSSAFVVATANDILKLPPELMRKGRFDEIFYVGLPTDAERRKIFEIHISKRRKNDLPGIDLDKLVQRTKGFSGADIEGVVKDGVESAFAANKQALSTDDLLLAVQSTHSLSEIMKEPLERMMKEYEARKFKKASIG